ncbi:unnamed protein product [Periconia digitata]|uniref:Uncharacterized protein n=1 Tax=Periconia digitata TaxID=1303443 RepID=A0A9W4UKQ2_9PLEO|nr:unnamed protein product [Periconia digitata]
MTSRASCLSLGIGSHFSSFAHRRCVVALNTQSPGSETMDWIAVIFPDVRRSRVSITYGCLFVAAVISVNAMHCVVSKMLRLRSTVIGWLRIPLRQQTEVSGRLRFDVRCGCVLE